MNDPAASLRLHLWRRLDWRFLLPHVEFERVLIGGRIDEELRGAVTLMDPAARHLSDGRSDHCDVAILRFPTRAELSAAASAVRPGGWVCAEIDRSIGRSVRPSTLGGWRRAFRRVGLEDVAVHWVAPNLAAPSRIVDLDHRTAVISTLARHQGMRFGPLLAWVGRRALDLGLLPLLVPAGVVVGRVEPRRHGISFIDNVLRTYRHQLELDRRFPRGWEIVHVAPRFVTSRHMVGLIYAPGDKCARVVVKVPRQPGDNGGVRREADILAALADHSGGSVAGVPKILGILEAGAYSVLVESALHGDQLDPALVSADLDRAVSAGVEFLASLPQTARPEQNRDWYDRTVRRPLAALVALAPLAGETADLAEQTHRLLLPLQSVGLPAVVEHADLSHPNLLIEERGALQVMDWERASLTGVPGHDLIFYLQYLSESTRRAYKRTSQLEAFEDAFCGGWAVPIVQQHLSRKAVDAALVPLLIVTAWARSAATLAERLGSEDPTESSLRLIERAVSADRDFWLWRHALAQLETGRLEVRPDTDARGDGGFCRR